MKAFARSLTGSGGTGHVSPPRRQHGYGPYGHRPSGHTRAADLRGCRCLRDNQRGKAERADLCGRQELTRLVGCGPPAAGGRP